MSEREFIDIESCYSVFEKLPAAVSVFKVEVDDNGEPVDVVFTYINNSYAALSTLSSEDCVGRSFCDVFGYEDDRSRWNYIHWNSSHNGQIQEHETYAAPLDAYFNIKLFPLAYGYCASILYDVTIEKKLAKMMWTTEKDTQHDESEENSYERQKRNVIKELAARSTTILYLNTQLGVYDTLKNNDVIYAAENEEYDFFILSMKNYLNDEDYALFTSIFSLDSIIKNANKKQASELEVMIYINGVKKWYRIEGIYVNDPAMRHKDYVIKFINVSKYREKSLQCKAEHIDEINVLTRQNDIYKRALGAVIKYIRAGDVLSAESTACAALNAKRKFSK